MNFPRIIGLKGKIGAGKSTAAEYFIARGYKLIKFADPIKNMLRAIGISEDQLEGKRKEDPSYILSGVTPRAAMQTLGDWGRRINPDHWVNLWLQEASNHSLIVVDDCRYPNEAQEIRALGGVVIEIRRYVPIGENPWHASEIQDWQADIRIFNEGLNRDVLFARLEGALEIWLEGLPCYDTALLI